jgi:hypothetical protein
MKSKGMKIRHPKARGEWAEMCFLPRATEEGLCVSKPWGDNDSYDAVTEYRRKFNRVQVKCTIYKLRGAYVCRVAASHVPYTIEQIDFIAAYVIPIDTWYILPLKAVEGQEAIVITPDLEGSKYWKYREAWHLLKRK